MNVNLWGPNFLPFSNFCLRHLIACSHGEFGTDCELACHCLNDEPCDIINGLCPGYVCDPDWTGPSCQTSMDLINIFLYITILRPNLHVCQLYE